MALQPNEKEDKMFDLVKSEVEEDELELERIDPEKYLSPGDIPRNSKKERK